MATTTITANELKTKGISALDPVLNDHHQATITVRGKARYVVMDIAMYNQLREYELDTAIRESLADIEKGDVVQESVSAHIKRILADG